MKLIVKQFDEVSQSEWDSFVQSSSMGYAYHLKDVARFEWQESHKNISFAIVDADKSELVLASTLYIERLRHHHLDRFRKKMFALHSRWGFCVKDELTPGEHKQVRLAYIQYIDELFRQQNIKYFDVALPALTERNLPARVSAVNPLIHFSFSPGQRYTYVVDLEKNESELLANCEQRTRQYIRKISTSEEYVVAECQPTEEDYAAYVSLMKETFIRTGAANSMPGNAFLRNLFFNLMPKGICRVFFLKTKLADMPQACITVLFSKSSAYYWWGASIGDREVGLNKFLMFHAILDAKRNGCQYFETGRAMPWLRKGRQKGQGDFKKCFGTFIHPIYCGMYQGG